MRAAEDEHPDLLWALRGGGVRLGVVLELELGLRAVGPGCWAACSCGRARGPGASCAPIAT
jgi:hypothetical protein